MDLIKKSKEVSNFLLKQLNYNLKKKDLNGLVSLVNIDVLDEENIDLSKYKIKEITVYNSLIDNFVDGIVSVFLVNNNDIEIFRDIRNIFLNKEKYIEEIPLGDYSYHLLDKIFTENEIEIMCNIYFGKSKVYFLVNENISEDVYECLKETPFGLLKLNEKKSYEKQKIDIVKRAEILEEIYTSYNEMNVEDALKDEKKLILQPQTKLFLDPIDLSYYFDTNCFIKIIKTYVSALRKMHEMFVNTFLENTDFELESTYYPGSATLQEQAGVSECKLNNCKFALITYGEYAFFPDYNGFDGFDHLLSDINGYERFKLYSKRKR